MRSQRRLIRRRRPGARALICAIAVALAIAGCAPFGGSAESEAPGFLGLADEESAAFAPEAEPAPSSAPVTRAEATGGRLQQVPLEGSPPADTTTDDGTPADEPVERLRVYTGDLRLSVPRIDQTRADVIALAEDFGGYVERSTAESVIVRVPAGRFFEALEALEGFGDVLYRAVQTADVTDQYTDIERRLEIATRSRDRLYELLERAEDADERVAILREIRRLTEEVERLRSAIESLAELIAYSRITVALQSRIQTDQVLRDRIPFEWIAQLDPLVTYIGDADRSLGLPVPDGFAAFESDRRVRAEAADGTRLRVGGRENVPAGSSEFWADAIAFHLEPFYRTSTRETVGPYEAVLFESKDREPFFYAIAVTVRGDELLVAEAFYPDRAAYDRHVQAVSQMLTGEGGEE